MDGNKQRLHHCTFRLRRSFDINSLSYLIPRYMARTQEELLSDINSEANKHEALIELQRNHSRVSVWGYVKQVIAFIIHSFERMLDQHQEEIYTLANRGQVGTTAWYAEQAKVFQYGHSLSLIEHRPGYRSYSAEARIIKHVAVTASNGVINVSVVKESATKELTPLSTIELSAFQSYLDKITFAGLRAVASSRAAEAIYIFVYLQIDETYISTTGLEVGGTKKPVEDAIEGYLRNLPFNGILRRTEVEDAIQEVDGVIDVRISAMRGGSRYFSATHKPASGHAKLSPTSGFRYSTSRLNY